jgi:hypothetical protein
LLFISFSKQTASNWPALISHEISCYSAYVQYYLDNVMAILTSGTSIKIIGANGQISLGKQYAGRQVLVEEQEAGVWLIRTATVIPDNERWLQEPQSAQDLAQALAWAQTHPAADSELESVLAKLHEGE